MSAVTVCEGQAYQPSVRNTGDGNQWCDREHTRSSENLIYIELPRKILSPRLTHNNNITNETVETKTRAFLGKFTEDLLHC